MTRYVHVKRTLSVEYKLSTDLYPDMDENQIRAFEESDPDGNLWETILLDGEHPTSETIEVRFSDD